MLLAGAVRRKAPSACGEAPEAGGSEQESGPILRARRLLRRLCSQETKATKLIVRKDHLLAAVTFFEVSQAGDTRKATDFGSREAE
jgi:hypothetical protein